MNDEPLNLGPGIQNVDALGTLIEEYQSRFKDFREQELYKWEAVKCFQDNWNPDAENFAAMLESSLAAADNLLAGKMYLPRRMLLIFAKSEPVRVRDAIVALLDESKDLVGRMKDFEAEAKGFLERENQRRADSGEKPAKMSYQDPRAMNVYLTFAHPESHYLYKWNMYVKLANRLDVPCAADKFSCVLAYRDLCKQILERIKSDYPDFLAESDAMLPAMLRDVDPEHHLLAQDIAYYVDAYSAAYQDYDDGWWPSLEEYDPSLSTEDWKALLEDPEVTTENALTALRCFREFPQGATCKEAAQSFGRTLNFYLSNIPSFGKRVHDKTNCPMWPRDDDSGDWQFALPCQGKDVQDRPGTYAWRLRPELVAALDSMGLPSLEPYGQDSEMGAEENPMSIIPGRNIILYGPPGTGKTYSVASIAWLLAQGVDYTPEALAGMSEQDRAQAKAWFDAQLADHRNGQVAFTTFHQSYGYEEFVEGIRPVIANDDDCECAGVSYRYEDGIFKRFCQRAACAGGAVGKPYIFVIDEINRGNISKVFGELITLIEPSKRAGQPDQASVVLPYTKTSFSVPANVTVIGTMNTADRSIAIMDTALRRRFEFVEMLPDYGALEQVPDIEGISVARMLRRMNERIAVLYDREHAIGHACFMGLRQEPTMDALAAVFRGGVLPLLQEYFYDDYGKIRLVLGDNQKGERADRFVVEVEGLDAQDLFGDADVALDDGGSFEVNPVAFVRPSAYLGIYETSGQ